MVLSNRLLTSCKLNVGNIQESKQGLLIARPIKHATFYKTLTERAKRVRLKFIFNQ